MGNSSQKAQQLCPADLDIALYFCLCIRNILAALRLTKNVRQPTLPSLASVVISIGDHSNLGYKIKRTLPSEKREDNSAGKASLKPEFSSLPSTSTSICCICRDSLTRIISSISHWLRESAGLLLPHTLDVREKFRGKRVLSFVPTSIH